MPDRALLPPADHLDAPAHLMRDDTGKERAYVWRAGHWHSHEWANPVHPRDAHYRGWEYRAPLYPRAPHAAEIAALRAEAARLTHGIQSGMLEASAATKADITARLARRGIDLPADRIRLGMQITHSGFYVYHQDADGKPVPHGDERTARALRAVALRAMLGHPEPESDP